MYSEADENLLFNGVIALDIKANRLVATGRVVRLSPAAVRVLTQFGAVPKTLLHRALLIEQGWEKYGLEVRPNGLNQVIHEIRNAFAQLDAQRNYIKTLPRLGYVLLADVTRVPEAPWMNSCYRRLRQISSTACSTSRTIPILPRFRSSLRRLPIR